VKLTFFYLYFLGNANIDVKINPATSNNDLNIEHETSSTFDMDHNTHPSTQDFIVFHRASNVFLRLKMAFKIRKSNAFKHYLLYRE